MAYIESDLRLNVGGFPPFSARGCTQTLALITNGELRRTVNGELLYTGTALHEKYKSVITCADKAPLAFDSLWSGAQVRVGCIQTLWQKFAGNTVVLSRDPVPGSVIALEGAKKTHEVQAVEGRCIKLKDSIKAGYVRYCPELDMRIVDISYETDEWGMKVKWRLVLEEV